MRLGTWARDTAVGYAEAALAPEGGEVVVDMAANDMEEQAGEAAEEALGSEGQADGASTEVELAAEEAAQAVVGGGGAAVEREGRVWEEGRSGAGSSWRPSRKARAMRSRRSWSYTDCVVGPRGSDLVHAIRSREG